MTPSFQYTPSVHTVRSGDCVFTVRNLTPVFPKERYEETKEKIEGCLYGIFRKYMT